MSKAMQYIRDLEAAGFSRTQAEAQVQMMSDTIENMATKGDLGLLQERLDFKFQRIDDRFVQFDREMDHKLVDMQFKLIIRLSLVVVSSLSVAVSILGWLIKFH